MSTTDYVGQQFGHYQLVRLLGSGAFAKVYLGEHRYLEVPAAIKILQVRMAGPEVHQHFRHEARTIARMQHSHIVRVLDFGIQDDTPYLVMDYLPHGTLRTLHPKGTQLPLEQVVTYVKQIAAALDYAHEHQVIHCDVKPENLLLNAKHEVVLSDFGLAIVQHMPDAQPCEQMTGTPLYMAPEQIHCHPCAASDQYALGIVTYEWLAGMPPFSGMPFELFNQHLHDSPPSLRMYRPDLPQAVEDAILGTLAKHPAHRFATVQDFAAVLEEVCCASKVPSTSLSVTETSHLQYPQTDRRKRENPKPPLISSDESNTNPIMPPNLSSGFALGGTTLPLPVPAQQSQASLVHTNSLANGQSLKRETQSPSKLAHARLVSQTTSWYQINRHRLLRKVRSFWIEGVLEHSLHDATLMALELETQPDAVAHPWHLVLHASETPPYPLPPGTHIEQAYDAAEGELLILGAPGAGKTTLLLELARELLKRAEEDEQHPIPVVFNLSSWAVRQQALVDWLVEELNAKYQVPCKLAHSLLEGDQILPLLDGLDEVAPTARTRCIEAINGYRQEHGLLPLVVCSRAVDYLTQSGRVLLRSAVMIQPLTYKQITEYLANGGEALWALRMALHKNATLRELTTTPLMLTILMLAYQDESVEELLREASLDEQRHQLFARYVTCMLSRRGTLTSWTQEQCTQWLCYLARQLRAHSQTIFYLEHLQPAWLAPQLRQTYHWLGIGLPAIVMGVLASLTLFLFLNNSADLTSLLPVALLGGLLGGLFSQTYYTEKESSALPLPPVPVTSPRPLRHMPLSMGIGLVCALCCSSDPNAQLSHWLIGGSLVGAVMGLGCFVLSTLLSSSVREAGHVPFFSRRISCLRCIPETLHAGRLLLVALVLGLSSGLGKALSLWLTSGMIWGLNDLLRFAGSFPLDWLPTGLFLGLSNALSSVLLFGLICALIDRATSAHVAELRLTERVRWTWHSLLTSLGTPQHLRATLWLGCLVALLSGLSAGLAAGWDTGLGVQLSAGLSVALSFGLSVALSYWFLLGLWSGIAQERLEDQQRQVPNQGIRCCLRNSLIMGIISALLIGVVSLLSRELSTGLYIWFIGSPNEVLSIVLSELSTSRGGLLVTITGGCFVWLLSGGWTVLQHYVLRRLLARRRIFPWRVQPFLDDMTTRLLLQRVGGGYCFVHRLLLEHFADLDLTNNNDDSYRSPSKQ